MLSPAWKLGLSLPDASSRSCLGLLGAIFNQEPEAISLHRCHTLWSGPWHGPACVPLYVCNLSSGWRARGGRGQALPRVGWFGFILAPSLAELSRCLAPCPGPGLTNNILRLAKLTLLTSPKSLRKPSPCDPRFLKSRAE